MNQHPHALGSGRPGFKREPLQAWKSKLLQFAERLHSFVSEKRGVTQHGMALTYLDHTLPVEDVQRLIKEAPQDYDLNTKEKMMLAELKKAHETARHVIHLIEGHLNSENLIELSNLWTQASQIGVV